MRSYLTFLLLCLFFDMSVWASDIKTPNPISGRSPLNTQETLPADVLARVHLLTKEVDLVRRAMGKPSVLQMVLTVKNASPREVYHQALALYKKSDRLAFEVVGSTRLLSEEDSRQISPSHVWGIVNEALLRILLVKKALNINEEIKEVKEPEDTKPTAVFNAIMQANHQLNSLLEKSFSPSQVYEQLTVAIYYAEQILEHLNVKHRFPSPPPIKNSIKPSDVFKRLVKCVIEIKEVAKIQKIKMLDIDVNDASIHQVIPSNVYDLATILVTELKHISSKNSNFKQVKAYYPGYKTPAMVYQRAAILLQQIRLIKSHMTKDMNENKQNIN